MFGVLITGPTKYTGMIKVSSVIQASQIHPFEKHNSINYHVIRDAVTAWIMRVAKEDTITISNLADALMKLQSYPKKQELLSHILWDH